MIGKPEDLPVKKDYDFVSTSNHPDEDNVSATVKKPEEIQKYNSKTKVMPELKDYSSARCNYDFNKARYEI